MISIKYSMETRIKYIHDGKGISGGNDSRYRTTRYRTEGSSGNRTILESNRMEG